MYSRDLFQNKVTRLDFMFLSYGVHRLYTITVLL